MLDRSSGRRRTAIMMAAGGDGECDCKGWVVSCWKSDSSTATAATAWDAGSEAAMTAGTMQR